MGTPPRAAGPFGFGATASSTPDISKERTDAAVATARAAAASADASDAVARD